MALMKPVFYQDKSTTLFVEPFVTERTIDGWDVWVTRTPTPDPGWDDDGWFDDIIVEPEFPWKDFDPGDPAPDILDLESLIGPRPREDWLVNPKTALVFDGGLIHATGRTNVEIQQVPYSESVGGEIHEVLVHPASDVGGDTIVVSTEREGARVRGQFGGSGIVNVVGGGGLNAGLKNNLRFDRQGADAGART
jgi:hypothetical protein